MRTHARIQYYILVVYSRCFVINAREFRFTIDLDDLTLIAFVRSVDESAVGIFIGFVNFFLLFSTTNPISDSLFFSCVARLNYYSKPTNIERIHNGSV